MTATYEKIATNTLSSAQASITLSSIPNTYTDLVLVLSLRATNTSTLSENYLQINGVTTSLYSSVPVYGSGGGNDYGSSRQLNQTDVRFGFSNGGTSTTSVFGSSEIYFADYASSATTGRALGSVSVTEQNGPSNQMNAVSGTFRSTNAITSILLGTSVGFATGSSFYLYGIKNS